MPLGLLSGIRVVRGPDWRYGDQDGGEGHAGTVIGLSDPDSTNPPTSQPGLSKLVNVRWDSGFKGRYRSGPKGSYDLRVS